MLKQLINISGKRILIPLYHSVSDEPREHIKNLYQTKTVKEFTAELDYILRYYKPVTAEQLIKHVNNEKILKTNSVLFTFDDGLREIKEVIAPILLKKGVPAVFFVNNGFVDNQDIFYRYKASVIISELERDNNTSKRISQILNIRSEHRTEINEALLEINYISKKLLDQIADEIGLDIHHYLKTQKPYLELNELQLLKEDGFVIGAHSVDHPEYYNITLKQQISQTVRSVNWIKENFDQDYSLFAFPFTDYKVKKSFFDQIFKDSRLKLDLTFGCAGIKDDYHKYHLQRLPMEVKNYSAKKILIREYRDYILKYLIGKSKIKRD